MTVDLDFHGAADPHLEHAISFANRHWRRIGTVGAHHKGGARARAYGRTTALHHPKEAEMSSARQALRHRLQQLRQVPFFANCSPAELGRIDQLGTEVLVQPGTTLIREGEVGRDCFVTLDGVATVERFGEPIAAITTGSIAGELALLDNARRNATVVATTPMRLLVLTPPEFRQLLNVAPSLEPAVQRFAADRRDAATVRPKPRLVRHLAGTEREAAC